jgi:uncharacterized tellurite resistance protein B-like protein
MEKGKSGYVILMLLTMADNKAHRNEDLVIRNWLIQEFNFRSELDKETEQISTTAIADYETLLQKHMDIFYAHSTAAERNNLIQFAMNVIKADGIISKGENKLFDFLYLGWSEAE